MRRIILLNILLIVIHYGNCQVGKMNGNRVLDKAISIYMDSIKVDTNARGLYLLEFTSINMYSLKGEKEIEKKVNGIIFLQFTSSKYSFTQLPSYVYLSPNKTPVLIYLGIEEFASSGKVELDKFRKQFQHWLIENSTKDYPSINIAVNGDSLSIIRQK